MHTACKHAFSHLLWMTITNIIIISIKYAHISWKKFS